MKDRFCFCGNLIPKMSGTGCILPPSKYKAKKTCSRECGAIQDREKKKDYPIRYCKICGKAIDKLNASGLRMVRSKYEARKTCSNPDCYRLAHSGHRKAQSFAVELDITDRFILGKL
jgi:hypothetical protein